MGLSHLVIRGINLLTVLMDKFIYLLTVLMDKCIYLLTVLSQCIVVFQSDLEIFDLALVVLSLEFFKELSSGCADGQSDGVLTAWINSFDEIGDTVMPYLVLPE
jgi:hypothetical protein